MATKEEENGKETRESDCDEDEDKHQLLKEQKEETGEVEQQTTNQIFLSL